MNLLEVLYLDLELTLLLLHLLYPHLGSLPNCRWSSFTCSSCYGEEAKDYLKEGTGQTELSNLEKALQESEQSREDRANVLQYLDPEQNPGFNFGQFKDDVKTISQFTEKDAKDELKKLERALKPMPLNCLVHLEL